MSTITEKNGRTGSLQREPAHRRRLAFVQRRHALRSVEEAWLTRDSQRRSARNVLRRVGAECQVGVRDRRLQRLEQRAAIRCGSAADPASGKGSIPDIEPGTLYKYHIASHAGGYSVDKADPLRLSARDAAATGVDRCGARLRLERRGVDGIAAATAIGSTLRCQFTRCTSARGGDVGWALPIRTTRTR